METCIIPTTGPARPMPPLEIAVSEKLASGFSTSLSEANVWQTRTFTAKSWWGNDYMHARYYSTALVRFLSPDPIRGRVGGSQSWNRYSYVLNNPVAMIDLTGKIEDFFVDRQYHREWGPSSGAPGEQVLLSCLIFSGLGPAAFGLGEPAIVLAGGGFGLFSSGIQTFSSGDLDNLGINLNQGFALGLVSGLAPTTPLALGLTGSANHLAGGFLSDDGVTGADMRNALLAGLSAFSGAAPAQLLSKGSTLSIALKMIAAATGVEALILSLDRYAQRKEEEHKKEETEEAQNTVIRRGFSRVDEIVGYRTGG